MPFDNAAQIQLRLFIATAEENKVQILREQIIQNAHQEIEAFLNIDPRNHREYRPVQVRWIDFEFVEESFLVFDLTGKVEHAVICAEQLIRRWIPKLIINAIENTDQVRSALLQNSFESVTELPALLNLTCIRRTDSR